MKNLLNIEKSAFRKGEYVGHADGVWRITKYNATTWRAWNTHHADNVVLYAETLAEMSALLEAESKKTHKKVSEV